MPEQLIPAVNSNIVAEIKPPEGPTAVQTMGDLLALKQRKQAIGIQQQESQMNDMKLTEGSLALKKMTDAAADQAASESVYGQWRKGIDPAKPETANPYAMVDMLNQAGKPRAAMNMQGVLDAQTKERIDTEKKKADLAKSVFDVSSSLLNGIKDDNSYAVGTQMFKSSMANSGLDPQTLAMLQGTIPANYAAAMDKTITTKDPNGKDVTQVVPGWLSTMKNMLTDRQIQLEDHRAAMDWVKTSLEYGTGRFNDKGEADPNGMLNPKTLASAKEAAIQTLQTARTRDEYTTMYHQLQAQLSYAGRELFGPDGNSGIITPPGKFDANTPAQLAKQSLTPQQAAEIGLRKTQLAIEQQNANTNATYKGDMMDSRDQKRLHDQYMVFHKAELKSKEADLKAWMTANPTGNEKIAEDKNLGPRPSISDYTSEDDWLSKRENRPQGPATPGQGTASVAPKVSGEANSNAQEPYKDNPAAPRVNPGQLPNAPQPVSAQPPVASAQPTATSTQPPPDSSTVDANGTVVQPPTYDQAQVPMDVAKKAGLSVGSNLKYKGIPSRVVGVDPKTKGLIIQPLNGTSR